MSHRAGRKDRHFPCRRTSFEQLERRMLLTASVHFTIDALASVHAISRYIYGVNQPLAGAYSNLTFERDGGNRWTAYNWENNASNAGSDYYFQNDGYLGGGNTPGGAVSPSIADASAHNAGLLLTVPMAGYVSADKNGGGDVRYNNNTYNPGNNGWINGTPNPNYLAQRFKQEVARKGSAFSLSPDTSDAYVYADEFVNWVKTTYPYSQTDPNRPIWFDLDNEPDLWAYTHAEIHPAATTYAEMVQRTKDYASAIKDAAPGSLIFGPVNYGWGGYVNLQGAPDAAGRDFLVYYLQQMAQAQVTYGKRLVDVLDVHWYPEAHGTNGIRITENDNSAATVAARLQAPRSLWDPTYTETSWITEWSTFGPIDLIPRLQGKINANYPGTKLSISEYNYGGGSHISGAIAEADVLGIFGRDGVFAANEWPLAGGEPFIAGAFNMYRNYDGSNGTFGNTSISASTDDVPDTSVYASYDASNPGVLTLIAINKAASPLTAGINLGHIQAGAQANVYQLTSASSTPQNAGTLAIGNPSSFEYTMPAYSVSTLKINLVAPAVNTASYQYETSPNKLSVTFSQDVAASLSAADVIVTPAGGGSALALSYMGSVANTATFSLPTSLADGNYTVTIPAAGVTDGAGNPLASAYSFSFFALSADANHDRHVDAADQAILTAHLGQAGTFSAGDFDLNGTVNSADQAILNSSMGLWLPAPGALGLTATAGDDAYKLRRETASLLDIYAGADVSPTYRLMLGGVTSISFAGGSGNDTLVIDAGNGLPLGAISVSFDGGNAGADTLKIIGTAGADAVVFNSASVVLGSTITYAGVESRSFDTGGGADNLTINDVLVALAAGAKLSTLTLNPAGTLDMADHPLILDYSGVSPLGTIAGLIQAGRNGGAWNAAGIITSMTAAIAPSILTTIGVAEASAALGISGAQTATFGTETVDATTVLVKYTYAGDANLDGRINIDDYFQIDSHYGRTAEGDKSYFNGDFNYDGLINGDDYVIIDSNFAGQGPALAAVAAVAAGEVGVMSRQVNFEMVAAETQSAYRRLIEDGPGEIV